MIFDLNNPPEGATHYNPKARTVFWYQKTRIGFDQFKAGRWTKSHDKQSVIDGLVALAVPDWSGVGRPPIGTVCEVMAPTKNQSEDWAWQEAKILEHGGLDAKGECAAMLTSQGSRLLWADEFRPIRRPEQAAAEARERKARELFEIVNPEGNWLRFANEGKARYLAAIDAGYRNLAIVDEASA